MTSLPRHLTEFPYANTPFPFHVSMNQLAFGYPAHRHGFFEFSLVIKGFGTELINGSRHLMKPGTFTFVMPYQVHKIETAPRETLQL
ncbi:AraC family ligand binding domain-containing protein [Bacillus solitudinis]|uniref:AraC family ligand binding domain-containing protein n=1 Tax=Bacillus solitudinis TaxID=2014074 RepID=UPI000C24C77A|nr:AraC family ligand binding domain-containing protein [Bacillus solitudinis]